MAELAGKVAVVTGAGSGIGLAIAERLALDGAVVFACDVSDSVILHAIAMRERQLKVSGSVADVSSAADMQRLMGIASEASGIHILVNNAGIGCKGNAVTLTEAEWSRTIDVNLKGMYLAAKYAIPHMAGRGGAAIINIGSIHAYLTVGDRIAYVASKAGVIGMTRALALNHGSSGIRVNSISPGPIDTPELRESWQKKFPDQSIDKTLVSVGEKLPSGRIGTVEDVAELVAFLCSNKAAFITGTDILIDGGAHTMLDPNL